MWMRWHSFLGEKVAICLSEWHHGLIDSKECDGLYISVRWSLAYLWSIRVYEACCALLHLWALFFLLSLQCILFIILFNITLVITADTADTPRMGSLLEKCSNWGNWWIPVMIWSDINAFNSLTAIGDQLEHLLVSSPTSSLHTLDRHIHFVYSHIFFNVFCEKDIKIYKFIILPWCVSIHFWMTSVLSEIFS
jgi:hypothetical protein